MTDTEPTVYVSYSKSDLRDARKFLYGWFTAGVPAAVELAETIYYARKRQMESIVAMLKRSPELYGDEWAARIVAEFGREE